MGELQAWLDNAPTLRGASLVYRNGEWICSLWLTHKPDESAALAYGNSVTFAVVAAILAFEAKQKA